LDQGPITGGNAGDDAFFDGRAAAERPIIVKE
jgi:hypothetical protein